MLAGELALAGADVAIVERRPNQDVAAHARAASTCAPSGPACHPPSDGSWTFVDANGRDIHKDYDAGRVPRHDTAHARSRMSRRDHENHRVTGYLPWLSR
jgi:hypothetical protein